MPSRNRLTLAIDDAFDRLGVDTLPDAIAEARRRRPVEVVASVPGGIQKRPYRPPSSSLLVLANSTSGPNAA